MVEAFEEFGILISEGYGITECSPLVSVNPYFAPKRGSVGPAVDCCEVIIDAERVNDLGYNEGEILVKGDNVMLGYYKNPEATAAAFTVDGYFRTGDSGYMDEDGYIYITGRKKSVIVLENGKNVFPEEIEEYLDEIETIAECVVIGRKAKDSDEVVLTVVAYPNFEKLPAGATEELIHETIYKQIMQINRRLPSFKQMKALELRSTEFEKTTSKKIKRHLVK
jgi:long-chain acyl-CoA synthetase